MENLILDKSVGIAKDNFPNLIKFASVLIVIFLLTNISKFFINPIHTVLIISENLSEACLMLILMFFLAYGSGTQKLRNADAIGPDLFFVLFSLFFLRSFTRAFEIIRKVAGIEEMTKQSSMGSALIIMILCVGSRFIFYYLGEKEILRKIP